MRLPDTLTRAPAPRVVLCAAVPRHGELEKCRLGAVYVGDVVEASRQPGRVAREQDRSRAIRMQAGGETRTTRLVVVR